MRFYHFFIIESIVESVNLIQMLKQNIIFIHHDGEQLHFYKKVHLTTQSKKKDVLVISKYCKKRRIVIYLTKSVPGVAKRIWKWEGQNVYWLRMPHHGWGQRARKFLKNWSLRLVKTHSKFSNYFPIILARLKIKASNTKKIDELIETSFILKG